MGNINTKVEKLEKVNEKLRFVNGILSSRNNKLIKENNELGEAIVGLQSEIREYKEYIKKIKNKFM